MSRLHRGRKLLQRALYNHALALGIIKGEDQVGDGTSEARRGQQPEAEQASKLDGKTASLTEYRARKRGVA
jgi:hypothetical protein